MTGARQARKRQDFSRELSEKGWYHSFALPDGTRIEGVMTLEHQIERYSRFPIPADLRGKTVLDIGAWDGWFSFEAERRGARVTAVDCVDIPNFRRIHGLLGSHVDYRILDFYDLYAARLGQFDYVFFLGVLYHLKHPFLALEIVSGLTKDVAVVESFVTDGDTWQERQDEIPTIEFYERDELGGQLDNWVGPSVGALLAMARSAGFARVELLHAKGVQGGIACFKRWMPAVTGDLAPAPELLGVMNNRTLGINFYTRRDEYVTIWFRSTVPNIAGDDIRFEIGGLGVPALYLRDEGCARWLANFRLPPGLTPGWHPCRVRLASTGFSNVLRVPVDIPAETGGLTLKSVCDGITWAADEVQADGGGHLTFWIVGLGENCDRENVRALLDDERLAIEYISEADGENCRQVNAAVPAETRRGDRAFRVTFGGGATAPVSVKVR